MAGGMEMNPLGEIVACALRPEGSLVHLAALAGFVWLAWRLAPGRGRGARPGRALRRASDDASSFGSERPVVDRRR